MLPYFGTPIVYLYQIPHHPRSLFRENLHKFFYVIAGTLILLAIALYGFLNMEITLPSFVILNADGHTAEQISLVDTDDGNYEGDTETASQCHPPLSPTAPQTSIRLDLWDRLPETFHDPPSFGPWCP